MIKIRSIQPCSGQYNCVLMFHLKKIFSNENIFKKKTSFLRFLMLIAFHFKVDWRHFYVFEEFFKIRLCCLELITKNIECKYYHQVTPSDCKDSPDSLSIRPYHPLLPTDLPVFAQCWCMQFLLVRQYWCVHM